MSFLREKITHSVKCFTGGAAAVTGTGQVWTLTYTGADPVPGEKATITVKDSFVDIPTEAGAGDITGLVPSFCFTYNNKEYLLVGPTVYFSALGDPTKFNDPKGVGNGSVTLTNYYQTPEDLVAMTVFQGRVVFLSRWTSQIWLVDQDPFKWQQLQILHNIGTFAKASVQPKGELDVLFLSDTGIRSLRARETTLNAFVEDLGSAVDSLVTTSVQADFVSAQLASSIVEPITGQYWLYLNGTIYVLGTFPINKVLAWSTFKPTYPTSPGGVWQDNTFTPEKFVVYQGQVYVRHRDDTSLAIYRYGGSLGTTYDESVATVELPWLDLKTPGTVKQAKQFNFALEGSGSLTWTVSAGMDPVSETLDAVYSSGTYTYDKGIVPWTSRGSHVKIKAVTSRHASSAKFSSFIFHYEGDEVK